MATFEWKGTHEGQLRRALPVRHLVIMLAVVGTIASGLMAGATSSSSRRPTTALIGE
jgi:amino acid permease